MWNYILRRLLLMIPTLFGITIVVFSVMAFSPGGISAQSLVEGQNLEPQTKKALKDYYNKLYGLDQPAPIQYLRWMNSVSPIGFVPDDDGDLNQFSFIKGSDLGRSFRYGRPVGELLSERVPITLLLNVLSIPLIYVIAIIVGVHAATDRGGRFDVTSNIVLLALWSVPTMLAGILSIGFLASEQYWRWFPTAGLNTREALDMPFLPHWSSLSEVLFLATVCFGLTVATTIIAKTSAERTRVSLFIIIVLAIFVVLIIFSSRLQIVIAALLTCTAGLLLVKSESQITRLVTAIPFGFLLAVLIAHQWIVDGFVRGFLFDRLWHLVLPVLCLSYGGVAFLARLSRSTILENLYADYTRTARAKGLTEGAILWRHVFRNSLLPLITVSATLLPALLGGSIIVESIFSIDGMGKLAVEAVQGRDRELVLSIALLSGILTLVSYLIADICYAMADPRVSYD